MASIYVDPATVGNEIWKVGGQCYRRIGPSWRATDGSVVAPVDCTPSGGSAYSYQEFSGSDSNVGPGGAHPNSDADRASFVAATTGRLCLINYECAIPLGNFSSKIIGKGVTQIETNLSAFSGMSADNTSSALGFNTTAGGSVFYRFANNLSSLGSTTFTFDTPITAFGCYLTGIEAASPSLVMASFNDGPAHRVTLPRNAVAGVSFWDVVCQGITSMTFSEDTTGFPSRDIFGK